MHEPNHKKLPDPSSVNKYYECHLHKPVSKSCPGSQLFNKATQRCKALHAKTNVKDNIVKTVSKPISVRKIRGMKMCSLNCESQY